MTMNSSWRSESHEVAETSDENSTRRNPPLEKIGFETVDLLIEAFRRGTTRTRMATLTDPQSELPPASSIEKLNLGGGVP